MPRDPRARADADRWMDWQQTVLTFMTLLFWGLVRTPEDQRDPAALAAHRAAGAKLSPCSTAAQRPRLHHGRGFNGR